MTSRWEGLPTVAIEAAQSRTLVAGFRIGPLEEVLGAQCGCLLTDPVPADLARVVTDILADDARRRSVADALHDDVRLRFSPDRMAQRYASLYRDLAQNIPSGKDTTVA